MDVSLPTLYLLMRMDLADMNPGKAMAQASHATNDFEVFVRTVPTIRDNAQEDKKFFYSNFLNKYKVWRDDRTFGRCIVLESTLDQIKDTVEDFYASGLIVDPTYPWCNFYGDTFTSNVLTCGWIFSYSNLEPNEELLEKFKLHR